MQKDNRRVCQPDRIRPRCPCRQELVGRFSKSGTQKSDGRGPSGRLNTAPVFVSMDGSEAGIAGEAAGEIYRNATRGQIDGYAQVQLASARRSATGSDAAIAGYRSVAADGSRATCSRLASLPLAGWQAVGFGSAILRCNKDRWRGVLRGACAGGVCAGTADEGVMRAEKNARINVEHDAALRPTGMV